MIYAQQPIVLFYLVLFLQAFSCGKRKYEPLKSVTPLPEKASYKKLAEDRAALGDLLPFQELQKDKLNRGIQNKPNQLSDENSVPFDFEDIIEALRKAADAKRGIRWALSGDTLIREVVDADDNVYAAEDYAVQILNIYRAAKTMCVLYGKDGRLFVEMARVFMNTYKDHVEKTEDFWIEKVKEENGAVVLKLNQELFTEENESDVNQKLRLAENYVGLDDTHYNVTTKFKVEGKQFALEDSKWLKLTKEQQSAFINRTSANWYKRLDSFERKLIDAYYDKFLDGAHYIPTQIRNIPGCRNAYQKRILAYDKNGNEVVLGRYYHSGALVSLIQDKDESIKDQISQKNWEQVVQHAKNIEVMSLNHNINLYIPGLGSLGEKHIVEPMNHIVGDDRFIYLPVNDIGTLTTPIFKPQVNKLLREASDYYGNSYPDLCAWLTKDKTVLKDMETQIEQITDPKDKCYFRKLKLLKEAAEKYDISNRIIHNKSLGTDNYYADIASNYITCKTVLDQNNGKSTPSILFFCKSGKDRTGFMSYLVDGGIISTTYPALDVDKGGKVYSALARAAHQQFLSSLNGGMAGRFGMKPVRQNKTVRDVDASKQLFPRAARSTVISLY